MGDGSGQVRLWAATPCSAGVVGCSGLALACLLLVGAARQCARDGDSVNAVVGTRMQPLMLEHPLGAYRSAQPRRFADIRRHVRKGVCSGGSAAWSPAV